MLGVLLVLGVLTCVACIAVGALVPSLRPMAYSGAAALVFLVIVYAWWTLGESDAAEGSPSGVIQAPSLARYPDPGGLA